MLLTITLHIENIEKNCLIFSLFFNKLQKQGFRSVKLKKCIIFIKIPNSGILLPESLLI